MIISVYNCVIMGWIIRNLNPERGKSFCFLNSDRTGTGTHLMYCWMGTGVTSPTVKRSGPGGDHSSPSRAETKNEWSGTSALLFIPIRKTLKVKWSHYRPGVAQRVGRDIALLFHDRGTRSRWAVSSTPRPHLTPGKDRYPFYSMLCGPQGRSGRAENLVPTGIRSRTVQSVVSRIPTRVTRPTYTYLYVTRENSKIQCRKM